MRKITYWIGLLFLIAFESQPRNDARYGPSRNIFSRQQSDLEGFEWPDISQSRQSDISE